MLKIAIAGMGNQGSKYAQYIASGRIADMELAAVTRIATDRYGQLSSMLSDNIRIYQSADDMYDAVEAGDLKLDAVIITTPHYGHEEQVIRAFNLGLHVLCDKPAGVYSRQARNMENALKNNEVYGFIFHQRTFPVYKKIREIVKNGKYGDIKRVNWVVTDWYRPDAYYSSGKWRATWASDGGGTLLNQCPHNLDLLQWICGMPVRTQAFCHNGKYHPIEVEDEVTAYMEWGNGATGVFIASTGEAPGVSRLEIALDDALLVCERGKLRLCALDRPEREYRKETDNLFIKPKSEWSDIGCSDASEPYETVLGNFAEAVLNGAILIAPGYEARRSLLLSNAIYLSSWEHRMVEIPIPDSQDELCFEEKFEQILNNFRKLRRG